MEIDKKGTNTRYLIGNSGSDCCKRYIYNSIGQMYKYWPDVFQMPHHGQNVNRYRKQENINSSPKEL